MADKTVAAEVTKAAEKVEAAAAPAPVAETRVEAEPKAVEAKAESIKGDPVIKAEPVKVEPKPVPVKTVKAAPAKVEPKPAPVESQAKAKTRKRVTKAKRTATRSCRFAADQSAKPAKSRPRRQSRAGEKAGREENDQASRRRHKD